MDLAARHLPHHERGVAARRGPRRVGPIRTVVRLGVDHQAHQGVLAAGREWIVRQQPRSGPKVEHRPLRRPGRLFPGEVPLRHVDEIGGACLRLPLPAPRGPEVAGVDDGQDRVHPHPVREVRAAEGPDERERVGEARGLEEQPIEVAAARELADRGHEIRVPDAAGAALGDLDPGPRRHRRGVDAGEATLVLEDADAPGGRPGQQAIEQGRLARAEEPRHQRDGQRVGHPSSVA